MDIASAPGTIVSSTEVARSLRPAPTTVLPMIGREQMLRQIGQAYRCIHDGAHAMVAVVGETGSGRTRVLREASRLPELAGAFTLELRLDHGADLHALLERALHEQLNHRRTLLPSRASAGRQLTIVELLTHLATVLPLVIIVDDIDAVPSGGATLGHILAGVAAPWLVIASTEPSNAVNATVAGRATDASITELTCDRFDHESIAALLRALTRDEPNPADVVWLIEKTHGLPVLLREAIEAAIRVGALVHNGGCLRRAEPIALCSTEFSALLPLAVPQLRALSSRARTTLATLALIGERVPMNLAAELGIANGDTRELLAAGLLRSDGSLYHFRDRVVLDAALASAAHDALDDVHAEVLARIVPGAIDAGLVPPAVTVERIVRVTADDARRREIVTVMLDAAVRMISANDFASAVVLMQSSYDAGVALVDEPVQIARWFEAYASGLYSLGRADEQLKVIEEFIARFPMESRLDAIATTIGRALVWQAEYYERRKAIAIALAHLDEAERIVASATDTEAATHIRYRAAMGRARIYNVADRRDEAVAILRQLLDDVDAEAYLSVVFDAYLIFSRIARTPAERAEVDERSAAMLERFEREGRDRLVVQVRATRIGRNIGEEGFENLEPEIRALLEQTRRHSLPRTESNLWVWLAVILADRGETTEAVLAIDRAIELRWRVGSIVLWQIAMITRAQILVIGRRDDEALATIAQIESDAKTYDRPCRRFLLDVSRAHVEVRRGEFADGIDGLAKLAEIGTSEGFEGTHATLLVLEGEILLHTFSIDRERARSFARRVLEHAPDRLTDRRLYPVALAVMARAHDDAATATRGKSGASDPILSELRRLTTETLSIWLECGATVNVAHALTLLRAHAPRALSTDDLAPVDARLPAELAGPSWHHCEVQTFGVVRVTDAAGNDRGGRHFGQHKTDSKPKKMLAALTVAAILDRRLKRERLIDMVWGESVTVETAANNFHVTLSGLRQVVGDVVDFDGVTYTLNTSLVRVDAIRVIELIDDAARFQRSGLLFRAYELLREANSLVKGEFLEGIYDDWTDGARELVRSKVRLARLRVAEIALLRAELDVVRQAVALVLEADGFDEEAHHLHLSLLRTEGERPRALREYDRFAERLASEYGTEPSARLRALRAAIVADA
jgi:DNA-binding SARP family transcriptional activator/tetratricopeptide (TPR) repeat protein